MKIPADLINRAAAAVIDGARTETGQSQAQLAERAGMSVVTVQKLLSGTQAIKIPQFLNLARATDLSAPELVARIETRIELLMSGDGTTPVDLADTRKQKQDRARAMTSGEMAELDAAAHELDGELDPNRIDDTP